MKLKSFLAVIILTGSILTGEICRAQDSMDEFPRHNIQVGYGFVSLLSFSTLLMNALTDAFMSPLTGTPTITDNGSWGPLYGSYSFYPLKWLGIGILGAYEQDNNKSTYPSGAYMVKNWEFATFMMKVNFRYGWEWVKFYHGIAGGFTYASLKAADTAGNMYQGSQYMFAFHLTAFGIRVGKTVGVFADIGIGYLGTVNIGVDFVF